MKRKIYAIITVVLLAAFIIGYLYSTMKSDDDNGNASTDYPAPAVMNATIVKVYPHDTGSFTQGLEIYQGNLYESTGMNGASRVMKVNLENGKIEKQIPLDQEYFGEGITILHDTVFQLTWQNKKVFVYTLPDFKKIKEFDIKTEGWGITNDGKNLIVSDGSNNLFFYRPADFSLIRTIPVFEGGTPAFNLNELEYIDGYVYANQWQYPYILKIDPEKGIVTAKTDLTSVINRVKTKDPDADFLNGIAYDANTKKIYVTGKLWPELYEIRFN